MFKKINFTHYSEIIDQREATLLLFNLKKCTCDELAVGYHSTSELNKLQINQSIKNVKKRKTVLLLASRTISSRR